METLNEFLENWYYVYQNQFFFLIIILSLLFLIGSLSIFLIFNNISATSLKKRIVDNFSVIIITKHYFVDILIPIPIIMFLGIILGIIPSLFGWILKVPSVDVILYVLINMIILYLIYSLFGPALLKNYSPSKYYLTKDWILLTYFHAYLILPLSSITKISSDKNYKMVRFHYNTKYFFFSKKSSVLFYCKDELFFDNLMTSLKNKLLYVEDENLNIFSIKIDNYRYYLKDEILEKDFKSFPKKLLNLMEILEIN